MDASGNMPEYPTTFNIEVLNNQAPSIVAPETLNVYLDENCEAFVPDLESVVTISGCGVHLYEQMPAIDFVLSGVQTTTVNINVTDSQTNLLTQIQVNLNVVDTIAPNVEQMSNMSINQSDEMCSGYFDPQLILIAEDACDSGPEIILIDETEHIYEIGTHIIEYCSQDASGNTSDTLSFTLTVLDTELPAFMIVNDTIVCDINFHQNIY